MIAVSSRENPHIKTAVRLRTSAAQRRASEKFFLEGFRLCADALASGYAPQELFLTTQAREKYDTAPLEQSAAQAFEITESVAQKLGDTPSPQGVFAVFEMQDASGKRQEFFRPGGHYIALESLQDPANLGAAARTAEALGFSGLILSGGCDLWHPKALRASMGALLRLPALQTDDLPATLRACSLPRCAAVPDREALSIIDCDFTRGGVLAIGNEGHGLSNETIDACEHKITIPMPGRAESLNAAAAAAILMWEMAKQTLDVRH